MLCLWTSAGVVSQAASFQHTSGALEAQLGHSNLDGSSPFIMTNLGSWTFGLSLSYLGDGAAGRPGHWNGDDCARGGNEVTGDVMCISVVPTVVTLIVTKVGAHVEHSMGCGA